MKTNETIRVYVSYADTRKAISYAVLYHVEQKLFSVYGKGLSIDLRTGQETNPDLYTDENRQFLYTNTTCRVMYFSNYENAKLCFDELVCSCMVDMYGYPDMLIERYKQQGIELRPDWFTVNDKLEKEENNFGVEGFSRN